MSDLITEARGKIAKLRTQVFLQGAATQKALDLLEALLPMAGEHAHGCASLGPERHQPGYTHYETDRGEPCPEYHYRKAPCNCGLAKRQAALRAFLGESKP